ncbi:MAG TPA: hypothetical protein VJL36_01260 [Candidatus Paceibacterota bacterium]
MYGEDRPTLQKILDLAEDNNQMLHRLQRARRWTNFGSALKWLVLIVASAGVYYYLQPLLERWPTIWTQFQTLMDNLNLLDKIPK